VQVLLVALFLASLNLLVALLVEWKSVKEKREKGEKGVKIEDSEESVEKEKFGDSDKMGSFNSLVKEMPVR
jgi:hypothetical protein